MARPRHSLLQSLVRSALGLLFLLLVLAGATLWWVHQPLALRQSPVELQLEPGTSAQQVAEQMQRAGVDTSTQLLYLWFRLSGQSRQIRAGSYDIQEGATPRSLLQMLVQGQQSLRRVTLVEGWTFAQMRAALAQAEHLRGDWNALSEADIMKALGREGTPAEGQFFPDTYHYAKGSAASAVFRRAHEAMQTQLQAAWAERDPALPLATPDQLLILASIVEKETGQGADRARIAGVFANRLRIGMRLQTDPTVIYGIGPGFDGNLRRTDLQRDTPWNTYTRAGLPPTPIAIPGRAALWAAARPAAGDALYFVARGDGSSQFSTTLAEHNRAVDRYQRRPNAADASSALSSKP